ncbi:MAG: hypothetical protein WC543_05970 [Candidatus Omnitrophota bacterium]
MSNYLNYIFVCMRGIKDEGTKNFSYIDVFDTLFISKENDFIWWSLCVGGSVYSNIDGSMKLEVTFVYPDGVTISPASTIAGDNVHKGQVYFTAGFPMIKFTQAGKYKLRVSLNGEELKGSNEFYFNVVKQA